MYREVMEHPIFKDSRVALWSGNLPSSRTDYPHYKEIDQLNSKCIIQNGVLEILKKIVSTEDLPYRVRDYLAGRKLAVYGLGTIGKALICSLDKIVRIDIIYDKNQEFRCFHGIPVQTVDTAG